MKKFLLVLFSVFILVNMMGQDFKSPLDHTQGLRYKSDEILVKFREEVDIQPAAKNNLAATGNTEIDQLLNKSEVTEISKVFVGSQKMQTRQMLHFPDGTSKKIPQLFNIYLLKTSGNQMVDSIISQLNLLPEVEYAEVNGEAYIEDFIPASEVMNESDLVAYTAKQSRFGIPTPNDPLYVDQWYIPEVKADSLWATTTGDTTQIISILDTGVDYLHPDLINKIWTNYNEIPDNGIDDDNNGYIDDVRGWDFVNQDNDPKDDNSHGTHCAGIAGAETNNGIGIAGVSWGAKIMPIKVFQSNGIGYFSHIAQGFWYAAENGSSIYSNSWSSGGESLTIRNAMEYAYAFGLIVAASGNMNYKTDLPFPPWPPYQPNYPACYNWVLGVEATQPGGENTWFSNFDPTGPIISDSRPYGGMYYNDYDYNYEMRAPGLSFISTVPNGQYRNYSGTSMACPLVAGSIALMKSYDPNLSNEQVFAKLIQPIKINLMQAGVLDIQKCTFTDPPAELYYVSHSISDSLYGGDDDGRPDAGETINMYVKVKNAGGLGDSIYARLRFAEFEDTTTAQILDSTCYLGSISAYGTNTSFDPIQIKIDSNVVHYRIISLELLIWSEDNPYDTIVKGITLTIEHGVEIKGSYDYLHLTGDAFYLVSDAAVIDSLVIDPGVTLTFNPSMFIATPNYVYAVGTPDSMITFTGVTEGYYWNGIIEGDLTNSSYEYCMFEYANSVFPFDSHNDTIRNCIFNYCKGRIVSYGYWGEHKGLFEKNVIINHNNPHAIWAWGNAQHNKSGIYVNNLICENPDPGWIGSALVTNDFNAIGSGDTLHYVYNNVFINNATFNLMTDHGLAWIHIKQNYFGTTNVNDIHKTILDFYENNEFSIATIDSILEAPPSECHGVVWKIEINGQNPQEVQMDPVGAGPMKVEVYFNRPMDTLFTPFVTFGVRYPFTQNIVMDSAYWSSDSTIWTGYRNIDMSTGDGENTFRVAYAKDTDHFEIPIERSRFHFVVQAAGSQSVAFMATPGIGKVSLEWPLSDSLNVLGYNLYRYKMPTDSTTSDTTMLNTGPVADSIWVDYSVLPDTTYYYMFTAVGTDFAESDYSKVMAATPFNAANGDANGDLAVNVLDITTIVSYMLNQNPSPFLFDAADVNYDDDINVLDIIGLVQLINGTKSSLAQPLPDISREKGYYSLKDGRLRFESKGNVAGLQVKLKVKSGKLKVKSWRTLEKLKIFSLAKGFEFSYRVVDEEIIGILYSMSGKELPEGGLELFRFEGMDVSDLEITEIFGGDLSGDYVPVLKKGENSPVLMTGAELQVNPNPFSYATQINYGVPEAGMVTLRLFDLSGAEVKNLVVAYRPAGYYNLNWNGTNGQGQLTEAGIYLLQLKVESVSGEIYRKEVKVVLSK